MTATYFDALGVKPTATLAEIKAAFRKLAQELHPDTNTDPKATEKFKLISRAYHELSTEGNLEQYARRARLALLTRSQLAWGTEWETLTGKIVTNDETHAWRRSDLDDLLRRTQRSHDAARAAQREAQRRADEQYRAEQEAAARASKASQGEYERASKARAKAANACGHMTSSGPCCRPFGHTPNGHMSQQVADQKRANQKARKARGY